MQPTLGQIGPITLRTYTLLLDLAILAGLGALAWRGWRVEDAPSRWIDAGLAALLGGLLGARLGHVLIHRAYFSLHREQILQFWRGGLDWHGVVLGGLLGLGVYSFLSRLSFRLLSDTLALPVALGSALTWAGCAMASCAYGAEVRSLADYPALLVSELPDLYGLIAPRFNSQMFGVGVGLVLVLLALLLGFAVRRVGLRLWVVLLVLSLGTFAIGYTRGDEVPSVGDLRLDQSLDTALAVFAVAGLVAALLMAERASRLAEPVEGVVDAV